MWLGSDNSKCHAGSMLHNVMLARLQEVLASFFKLTIEVCESKRTIGMFPIVGDATYERDSINPSIKCASMIDGQGKEVLAGKQENQKIVSLDFVLANNNIIIWENPDDDGDS